MAVVRMYINPWDFEKVYNRLDEIQGRAENLRPAVNAVADYMVRSIKNRFKTKRAPDGKMWPANTETTIYLKKGRGSILIDSGNLKNSIRKTRMTSKGMAIVADATEPRHGRSYASYMQRGVKRTSGKIPGKRIPPRPYMGYSKENVRRIGQIFKDYLDRARADGGGQE